ncbi:FkbM family methyltransferase [Pedobacter sp. UYP30]|uniref:FkbM family methyltransferase n=1 Tax=Pedobacter sp. UYP30 TaxID=1756400 RepID=UPI00339A69FC
MSLLKSIIKNQLKKIYRRPLIVKDISYKDQDKLTALKRFEGTEITFMDINLNVVDNTTFIASYLEIFRDEVYKFETKNPNPIMIDCGANIGLATIYLKKKYPNATVIAFEPDPRIFNAMQKNIQSFQLENVTCLNKAVSTTDGFLNFNVEGGHSGKLSNDESNQHIKVEAIRLKSFLQKYQAITFLKIDIEGHEKELIPDIAEELKKVEFLFLEYHSFLNESQCLDEILMHIKNAGFRYYIQESCPKPNPFFGQEMFSNMDCLVNIFCYRN